MAFLDTIGRIWSGGKFVAPHTWFSCVHDDNDSDRTLADVLADVGDSIKNVDKGQVYTDKVAITTETVDGVEQSVMINAATKTFAGVMSASDKAKLDGLNANDYVNGVEVEYYDDTVELNTYAKSGMPLDNFEIRSASTTQAGVMSKKDKVKLDGIESGAQKNPNKATERADGLMSKDDKKFVESSKDLMTNPDFLARTIGYKTSVTSGDDEGFNGHLVSGEKIILQIIRNTGTIKISFGDFNITTKQSSGWYQSTEVPNLSYGSSCDIEAIGGDCEFVMYIK